MTRFPLPPVPVLALTSALALAACGGGGGGPASTGGAPDGGVTAGNGGAADSGGTTDGGATDNGGSTDDGDVGPGTAPTTPAAPGGGGGVTPSDPDTQQPDPDTQQPDPPPPPATVRLSLMGCPAGTLCGVSWNPTAEPLATGGTLDPDATPVPGGTKYDDDGDPVTDLVDAPLYRFQASYTIPDDDPMTSDVNERDDYIALIEQDVLYARHTVDAVADVIGIIRTGRENDDLGDEDTAQWFAGAEIADYLGQKKGGAPVAAFSATLPFTSVNPVAQIIAARGVSRDLRGAADEDFDTIALLLAEIARYEARAMLAKAAIDDRRRAVEGQATPIRNQITSSETVLVTLMSELDRLETELESLEAEKTALNDAHNEGNLANLMDSQSPPGSSCQGRTECMDRRSELNDTADNGLIPTRRGDVVDKKAEIDTSQTRLRNRRTRLAPLDERIRRLGISQTEIQYWLDLIAAAESAAAAQQTADRAALAALPADIESAKAAAIRTALEGIVNAPGATDPATARFARDGNLADLDEAAGNPVFARRPAPPSETALYADYGMWLEGTDAAPVLRTRMGLVDSGGTAGTVDLTTTDNGLAATATYSGTARGLSARTTGTGDDATTASGHFTADVSLSATFGASPTLGGTVRNFRAEAGQGGGHVGPWSIDLPATGPRAGTGDIRNAPFDNVGTDGHPTDGGWSAYAYGAADARPVGVYGGFQADFADGAAIGQFDATAE